MDMSKIRQWESAVDSAELSPITANLPTNTHVGATFEDDACPDGIRRLWRRVLIVSGNVGARWAYWAAWVDPNTLRTGTGPHPDSHVIVDKIFNGDAAHFVGMLGVPYHGKVPGVDSSAWVLVSPRIEGPRTVHVQDERKPADGKRYEHSKEVHDVDTGTTKILP